MSSNSSMRTIWLTLRATNYTTAVLTNLMSQMNGLIAKETQLNLQQMLLGKSAISAGIMFNVLGSQMGGLLGQFTNLSGSFMIFFGALSMASGLMQSLTAINWAHTASVFGLDISYKTLAISIGAAFASFMVFYQIFKGLPPVITAVIAGIAALAAVMWAYYFAESAAFPIAGVLGGIAAAGALATYSSMTAAGPAFQSGTRMIGHTGPAILHAGEIVYNPSTNRPTQVGNDLTGEMGGRIMDNSIHIDNVNTKTDTEELKDLLKRYGRKIAIDTR